MTFHFRNFVFGGGVCPQARYQEKTPEQELMEKRRQMPFHTHINLDMLEAVCLICAMLQEVPNMAANPLNPRKRIISKSFHRIMDTHSRQVRRGRVGGWGRWYTCLRDCSCVSECTCLGMQCWTWPPKADISVVV